MVMPVEPPAVAVLPTEPPRAERSGQLPPAGPLELGSVRLPAGRPVIVQDPVGALPLPTLWVTDAEVPEAGTAWAALAAQFPSTGLWPLLLQGLYDGSGRPWANGELSPVTEAEIGALDPHAVLEDGWRGWLVPIRYPWAPGTGPLAPFGPDFPGLAEAQPEAGVELFAEPTGCARLGLVSCRRPSDAIGLAGWHGAINYRTSAEISAVLRSWEERFGAFPVGLGFATLTLVVTRPPIAQDQALRVAAEVAALCPDALWQPESLPPYVERECSLESISRDLVRDSLWRLWWD
jgi:hypothetical protein